MSKTAKFINVSDESDEKESNLEIQNKHAFAMVLHDKTNKEST